MAEPSRFAEFLAAARDPQIMVYPPRQPGDLPGLSKGRLNETQQEVEARFAARLSVDWSRSKQDYDDLAIKTFGTRRLVDLDLARELAGPDVYNTPERRLANLMPTNGPAAQLTDERFGDLLAEPAWPGQNSVLYLMGVGCSGKTTAALNALRNDGDHHHAIFTRVTSPIAQVESVIKRILDAGKEVDMRLVLRKPEALFEARFAHALATGETEPLHQVALRYGDCLLAFEYMHQRYQANPDPRVKIGIATNFGTPNEICLADNPLQITNEIKKGIPGLAPLTGNPETDAINLKTALVEFAYQKLASYDAHHPAGTAGHLPEGPLRTSVIGNRDEGLSRVGSQVYNVMTLADLQAWNPPGRPARVATNTSSSDPRGPSA